jgi:hypothetical protein
VLGDGDCGEIGGMKIGRGTEGLGPCGIFKHLLTINETWIHIYDPETKKQSKE